MSLTKVWFAIILSMLHKIKQRYRYSAVLLRELVITDFKLRYQGSVLGYMWSLLKPMFIFIILYLVFVKFLKVGAEMPHWPVGLLIGIVMWNFFSEVTSAGVGAVVSRGDIIRKINFPKYILILATSASALINLGLNLIIITIFLIFNGVEITWSILLAPFFMLEILMFGVGISLLLSALFVRFRDVNFIWEIIMQGMFYGSVVIYPLTLILINYPGIATALLLNPVAQAIQDIRHVVISEEYPTLLTIGGGWLVLVPHIIVLTVFMLGAWYFRRQSARFAEDM